MPCRRSDSLGLRANYGELMAVLLVATYNISDPDTFAKYNPGSVQVIASTIARYGGRVAFAAPPEMRDGEQRDIAVGVEFPDKASARAWLDDPKYAEVAPLRIASTSDAVSFMVELLA
jgi:uncharacterized protein (DUF1330 family)